MADIFISYAREDQEKIQPLVRALEGHGWSVFWDRRIPAGKTWRSFVGEALHKARCVIVAWSSHSIVSKWVMEEADEGQRRGILVPVLLEPVDPPMGFRSIQAADLHDWQPDSPSPQFAHFVQDVSVTLRGTPGAAHTGSITASAPPRRNRLNLSPAVIGAIAVIVALLGALAYWKLSSSNAQSAEVDSSAPAPPAGSVAARPPAEGSAPPREPTPTNAAAPSGPAAAPPDSDAFAITIGVKVSDGVPAAGAGIIAKPFELDVYTFKAAPRQTVYFRVLEASPSLMGSYLGWRLVDDDGTEIFNRGFYTGEPGVLTLIKGGTYTLTVGSKSDRAIGYYQFQVFNVPRSDQFTVEVGSTIQDGRPAPGAGYIESPGAKDIYTFSAEPREKVYFRVVSMSPTLAKSYVGWRLVDPDGTELFNRGFYTGDPGVQTLMKGGVYTLTVGSNTDPATGTYEVALARPD